MAPAPKDDNSSEATISDFLSGFFSDPDECVRLRAIMPKDSPDSQENRPVMLKVSRRDLATNKRLQSRLRGLNKTRGIYFIPNAGGDKDAAIERFNAVFHENDTLPIAEQHRRLDAAPLPTSARVETLKSVHGYYFLTGDCSKEQWRDLQARLIAHFDSDPTIKNPSRLMRLPFFHHLSMNGNATLHRKRVELVQFEPSLRYTVADLLAAFPPLQGEEGKQDGSNHETKSAYVTWDALRAECDRRLMAHSSAHCNSAGNWDCQGICHNGKGKSGLVYFPSKNRVHCNKTCDEGAVLRAFGLPERPDGIRDEEVWSPPVPFYEFRLPAFPISSLPEWLREFVDAESTATQTPVDLAAMLLLSVCAAACAKKIVVQIRPGWREPVNLFAVTVLPPANRKTRVFDEVSRPLAEHEEKLVKDMAPLIAEADNQQKILEARLRSLQSKAAKSKPNERKQKEAEAAALMQELSETKVPAYPRLIADDCSPERLATLLRDQGGRLAVLSPEGDVFDLMAGRYSSNNSPNFGVYLKGHAGDDIRVDRIGRPSEFVKKPALTVGLAVQPEVLRGLIDKPGFRGRGLLGRFLYSLPVSLLGRRDTKAKPVPDTVRSEYEDKVKKLTSLPDQKDDHGNLLPQSLELSRGGDIRMQAFEAWIEPQLAEFGALGSITDWAGKLAGAVARIAGILHTAEHADSNEPWCEQISEATIERAISIGEYLIPHAHAAFAEMGADPGIEDATHVLRWIEHSGKQRFAKRDAFEGTKGRFKRVTALEPALKLLGDHGYIREQSEKPKDGPGRKLSPVYNVNPLAPSHNSHNSHNSEQECNSANTANSANRNDCPG